MQRAMATQRGSAPWHDTQLCDGVPTCNSTPQHDIQQGNGDPTYGSAPWHNMQSRDGHPIHSSASRLDMQPCDGDITGRVPWHDMWRKRWRRCDSNAGGGTTGTTGAVGVDAPKVTICSTFRLL